MSGNRGPVYARISKQVHSNRDFMAFDRDTKYLWLCLLTHPKTTITFPGVVLGNRMELAGAFGYTLEEFDRCFKIIIDAGFARHDEAGLTWLSNSLEHNNVRNGNHIKNWFVEWFKVPDCPLRDEIVKDLRKHCQRHGGLFVKQFTDQFGDIDEEQREIYKESLRNSYEVLKDDLTTHLPPSTEAEAEALTETEEEEIQEGGLFVIEPPPKLETVEDVYADPDFKAFWRKHPKGRGKKATAVQWLKLRPDRILFKSIMDALEWQTQTVEPRYLKDPERWLRDRRWEDEPHRVTEDEPKGLAAIRNFARRHSEGVSGSDVAVGVQLPGEEDLGRDLGSLSDDAG